METGSLGLALAAAFFLLGGLFLETRVALRWRVDGYFLPSLPLGSRLVPIARVPEGSGRTASVRWEVSAPHLVRFWADPNERSAPSGLHGVIVLAQGRRGIELDVRWAPPWTPVFAALWLVVLGIVRGEAALTVPIAAVMIAAIGVVYWQAAHRAAAELRWALQQGTDDPTPG